MGKKKETFIPPSIENAIKTIKDFCSEYECRDCPLYDDTINRQECSLRSHNAPEYWEI